MLHFIVVHDDVDAVERVWYEAAMLERKHPPKNCTTDKADETARRWLLEAVERCFMNAQFWVFALECVGRSPSL